MALSTTKPIIVRFAGHTANSYEQYTVQLRFYIGGSFVWQTIYTGRTWIDSNGNSEIRIDGILRDYIDRWKHVYDIEEQVNIPADLHYVDDTINPVEAGSGFFFSRALVVLSGDSRLFTVWGGFAAPWQSVEIEENTSYNLGTLGDDIMPHIPPVLTDAFWLGVTYYDPNGQTLAIGFSNVFTVPLNNVGQGTIRSAIPLSNLYTSLREQQVVDGGFPQSTQDNEVDGGLYNTSSFASTIDGGVPEEDNGVTAGTLYLYASNEREKPLAVIDSCARDFYVAWINPQGGWTCYGFNGNAVIGGTPEVQSIIDRYDSDEVISMEQQHTYNLYTEPLTKDMYNHLATMKYAREVYVYDSKRDAGHYCTVDGRGIDTMPSKTGKLRSFNIVLKEIMRKGI